LPRKPKPPQTKTLGGAHPHCSAAPAPGDNFCKPCRARLDDIISRCFHKERGKSVATVESNAELVAKFIRDNGTATTKGLRAPLGMSQAAAQKAANFARHAGWIALAGGPTDGYVVGDVEIEQPETS
jgi:hypothetical protein